MPSLRVFAWVHVENAPRRSNYQIRQEWLWLAVEWRTCEGQSQDQMFCLFVKRRNKSTKNRTAYGDPFTRHYTFTYTYTYIYTTPVSPHPPALPHLSALFPLSLPSYLRILAVALTAMEKITKETTSSHGSIEPKQHTAAYTLDAKRREALREVDEAQFSYVLLSPPLSSTWLTLSSLVGST